MPKGRDQDNVELFRNPDPQGAAAIPLTTRLAIEIPKPKNWQDFQRNCVLLFQSLLQDPHAQEFGRSGQKQGGIDILGLRGGRGDHYVGVQCRLYTAPIKQQKILADARAALKLKAGLKELIFATTTPDDTKAAEAAIAVTRTLQAEGHDLRIVVYGWGQLQTLIAPHDAAYNAFHPSAVARSTRQDAGAVYPNDLAALISRQVVAAIQGTSASSLPRDTTNNSDEDPALHARIDMLRDLFRDGEPVIAEKRLLAVLDTEDLSAKPWARFRLETNLGCIAMDLGREGEAATRFEAAHAIQPVDPNGLANLALARTIQGRFAEAMALAQAAVNASPRADYAVAYLLQAAARSDWQGEPETLIPGELAGTAQADLGLAEFLRRRDVPRWAERSLEMARRHADVEDFKRIRAIAVLSLAIESGGIIQGGYGPVTGADLSTAADDTKALVEHLLDVGFQDRHDLMAHLNNAAVLLRLCQRHAEAEALLVRGMPSVGDEPQLRRLLALARTIQDHDEEAIAALEGDGDPENQILRAEIQAGIGDLVGAYETASAVNPEGLPTRLQQFRWRILGELALQRKESPGLAAAVAGLRALDPSDIAASLLEIRDRRNRGADEDAVRDDLRALAASARRDADMLSRYLLALELQTLELPEETALLLEGHIDLDRPSPGATLYLQSLAAARRDAAFRDALASASPAIRNDPGTLWTVAAHAWNLGDLTGALAAVESLLAQCPDEPRARLLKVEILIRQDRSALIFEELDKPLERLDWKQPNDQFRLATLLGHFGYAERAASLAYGLFLQHRDLSRAWMTLSTLVLEEGRTGTSTPPRWSSTAVGANMAVDLRYDDSATAFFVIEPEASLRKQDPDSWEPEHALARAVSGRQTGERFQGPDGRSGTIQAIRHKYVARLQQVMATHATRFPEIAGFRSMTLRPADPGGLDELIAQIKARQDWLQEEEDHYQNGVMPLSILAHRVGMDTIDVGVGLAGHGSKLKVAQGSHDEREAASTAVRLNARRGCVLDLLSFWTGWKLNALDIVGSTCGPVQVPQSVIDRLRARRAHFESCSRDGFKSAGYEDGKILLSTVPGSAVADLLDDVGRAIAWIEANATVSPIVAGDDLPEHLREHLRLGRLDTFDSLILARQSNILLVTDDLPTREVDRAFGGNGGTWLHVVFAAAVDNRLIDFDRYIRLSAQLIEAGQNYLGVSGIALARAASLDASDGQGPGYLFEMLCRVLGGRSAEPSSHVRATLNCLGLLWNDENAIEFRERSTGVILRNVVRDRHSDYRLILRAILAKSRSSPGLNRYILHWLRGHFFEADVLRDL